jgi:hypothetical protein
MESFYNDFKRFGMRLLDEERMWRPHGIKNNREQFPCRLGRLIEFLQRQQFIVSVPQEFLAGIYDNHTISASSVGKNYQPEYESGSEDLNSTGEASLEQDEYEDGDDDDDAAAGHGPFNKERY